MLSFFNYLLRYFFIFCCNFISYWSVCQYSSTPSFCSRFLFPRRSSRKKLYVHFFGAVFVVLASSHVTVVVASSELVGGVEIDVSDLLGKFTVLNHIPCL